MSSQDREIRVCLIGDGAVGKSSVLSRLMGRAPTQRHDPTIEDSYFTQAVVDGEVINIRYLDTSGQDEYELLVDVSINASNVVIVVCDVARDSTFNKAEHRVRKVTRMYEMDCPPIILVANKTDKEPVEDAQARLQKMARDLEVPIVWTSAFTGDGIDDLKDRIYSVTPTPQEDNPKCCCTLL
jgi:GTPase KRas protein